ALVALEAGQATGEVVGVEAEVAVELDEEGPGDVVEPGQAVGERLHDTGSCRTVAPIGTLHQLDPIVVAGCRGDVRGGVVARSVVDDDPAGGPDRLRRH